MWEDVWSIGSSRRPTRGSFYSVSISTVAIPNTICINTVLLLLFITGDYFRLLIIIIVMLWRNCHLPWDKSSKEITINILLRVILWIHMILDISTFYTVKALSFNGNSVIIIISLIPYDCHFAISSSINHTSFHTHVCMLHLCIYIDTILLKQERNLCSTITDDR